jgi:hypothetical protein
MLVTSATTTEAQVLHRRGYGRRVVVVGGYYPYYDPFWYGDPWYGYQYPWRPYPPLYGYGYAEAAVRFEVTPKEAEVYVDGYYAGVVDDFNGVFQRLRVEPGEHEIELYLDGYKPVRQKVYLTPDNTFKIRYTMERLAAGEQGEPRPQPVNPPPAAQGGAQPPAQQPPMRQPPMRGPAGRRMPPPPQQTPDNSAPRGGQTTSAYGALAIRVQPADAEISIDGDNWRGPGGQERLVIEVAEGSHTVEIRKAGYRTYVTQAEVRRGETTPINVSLRGDQ